MITTRTRGMEAPPERRKRVCSGEFVLSVNWSWKTLGPSSEVVTDTEVTASRMS
jgi:hypothetical protein